MLLGRPPNKGCTLGVDSITGFPKPQAEKILLYFDETSQFVSNFDSLKIRKYKKTCYE
jgi:hypothetical protein